MWRYIKPGDKVICINDSGHGKQHLAVGNIYEIFEFSFDRKYILIVGDGWYYRIGRFRIPNETICEKVGII